ncbi:MAG: MBL fold metallo-hydrolase [Leptolyngbyaceae cyanobacterium SL_7_1]|nr:MBL fold metallo-hydrolase [Leptolyngbyaceae cyanobacterium SL_7_1]
MPASPNLPNPTPSPTPVSVLRPVLPDIYAFPPNRDTLGGTAYLILHPSGNGLVDCPAWDEATQAAIEQQGGIEWLFLTHRGAIGNVAAIQSAFSCKVVIQEQEAYLLPNLVLAPFRDTVVLNDHSSALWTPGHSPGSACLYDDRHGGVLFTGRHVLPNQHGEPVPLRLSKTFHWWRQLQAIQLLRDRFSAATLHYLCPGANIGFLRGNRSIDRAYERLAQLDLDHYRSLQPG